MTKTLDKDLLRGVNGVGDAYAEDILEVYSTDEELVEDGAEVISDETGVPVSTIEDVLDSLTFEASIEDEASTEEEEDEGKEIDRRERYATYDVIFYEDGTSERDEDGGRLPRD